MPTKIINPEQVYRKIGGVLTPVPSFYGWVAVPDSIPLQSGDVMIRPYDTSTEFHSPTVGKKVHDIYVGQTPSHAYGHDELSKWCTYRWCGPYKTKHCWKQVMNGGLVQEGDIVMREPRFNPERFSQENTGWKVLGLCGSSVESCTKGDGNPDGVVWRMIEGPAIEKTIVKSIGDYNFSQPLPLP